MYFLSFIKYLRYFFSLIFLLFIYTSANAQLQANFSADKNGGCSPLTVSFTNTTTGASSNATYQWDFGNGNTSSLINAGATYVFEQSYAVTLTVTDGTKTSSQTKQIVVYKRPTVDFTFDVVKGCLPLPVNFNATATAGDGSIANYYWDFGDGNTQQTSAAQIAHTYNFVENSIVGLTVTNNYGCYSSVEKNATKVLPSLQASFNANQTQLCNISDAVSFTNTSSGSGLLNYAWDFGDGTNSTTTNPSHAYNKKGTYTVGLTVSNADGCSVSSTQYNYVNVRNFNSDFAPTQVVCKNNNTVFSDKSVPEATLQTWFVDGAVACYYCYGGFPYIFPDTLKHTVRLINNYGGCFDTVTKIFKVNDVPDIKPFNINIPTYCNAPVSVSFKDTTKNVTAWSWTLNNTYYNNPFSTGQPNANYFFANQESDNVILTVTNAAGCTSTESQNVNILNTFVSIQVTDWSYYYTSCDTLRIGFSAYSVKDSIASYKWDFGDGSTSTAQMPSHFYSKPGNYIVTLSYVTKGGCTGSAQYNSVQVYKRPHADFSVTPTICGNMPTIFSDKSIGPISAWYWDFGGNAYAYSSGPTPTVQYSDSGTYTIKLIVINGNSACADTVTKLNYVKVLPPFPKISNEINTCDGNRGLVKFTENSKYTNTWKWDFGDGNAQSFTSFQDTVLHNYSSTGTYKIILSATNGQCIVKDSTTIYVLLKQKPILSATTASICANDVLNITVANMQTNPYPYGYYSGYYYPSKAQYGDTTNYNGYFTVSNYNSYLYNSGQFTLSGLDRLKSDIRVITTSYYFGCNDTSNYIPVKIHGPKAGFKIVEGSPCYAYPVILQDTSVAGNSSPIKTWHWIFGDNTFADENKSSTEYHKYPVPGGFYPQLTVTDADGCSDETSLYTNNFVYPSGPKSLFTYNPTNVTPNTSVSFYNNTNDFGDGNTQYKWLFGDGNSSTDFSPQHIFSSTGTYTVKLIASNPVTHCIDTSTQIINVKIINTAFSFNKSFITSADCPPVIVQLTNTSANANTVAWDFGDGSKADNQNNPSHTYYKAGTYKITLYGYGYNNTVDTTVDSIIVKAPSAKIKANPYFGCTSQLVTLSALTAEKGNSFNWDFGDGTVAQSKDTFSVHQFLTAGVYEPSLIVSDSNGCSALNDSVIKVVVDSLFIAIKGLPDHLCDSAQIFLKPQVVSVAADQAQQTLIYHWDFGTGNVADTSNIKNAIFTYKNSGTYTITFNVTSPYGCAKQASQTITVYKSAKASINGPLEICQNGSAQFNGSASLTDNIQWQWIFNNGNNAAVQNPSPQIFNTAGDYKILLIINHSGCYDTAVNMLTVHPNPTINVTPKQAVICLGKTIQLNANDGANYLWSPSKTLDNNTIASPVASPVINTTYIVQSTTSFGCSATDSSVIAVAQPFKVKIPADTFVCKGSNIMLAATGANTYNWISGDGLNNTQIANPVALPQSPTSFTVVGYDAYQCFTDTETVHINIEPLPTVNAGADVQTLTGSTVQLGATGSVDVTQWSWLPVDYLSCTDCESPVSTPRSDITYIVTGKNIYGCAASDTVIIKLVCAEDRVYVPSVFSPNNDGNNDVFYIKGKGIKTIKSLRVFSRWGQMVFERTNINIDDRTAGWDGNFKGSPVSTGAYVYIAELQCDTGEVYALKGTLVITR